MPWPQSPLQFLSPRMCFMRLRFLSSPLTPRSWPRTQRSQASGSRARWWRKGRNLDGLRWTCPRSRALTGSGTWVDERAQRQGLEKPHGEFWSSFCNGDGMGSYDEGRWFYHSQARCFGFSGIHCGGSWHRRSNNGAGEPQPDTGHHRQQGFQTQSRRCYCSVCRIFFEMEWQFGHQPNWLWCLEQTPTIQSCLSASPRLSTVWFKFRGVGSMTSVEPWRSMDGKLS